MRPLWLQLVSPLTGLLCLETLADPASQSGSASQFSLSRFRGVPQQSSGLANCPVGRGKRQKSSLNIAIGLRRCPTSDRDSKRQRDCSCKHLKWLLLETVPNRRSTKLWRKTPSPASNLRNREFSRPAPLPGRVVFIGVFRDFGHEWHWKPSSGGGGRGTGIEPSPRKPACLGVNQRSPRTIAKRLRGWYPVGGLFGGTVPIHGHGQTGLGSARRPSRGHSSLEELR